MGGDKNFIPTRIQECLEHKGYSKSFGEDLWNEVSIYKRGYKTPRVPYLLEAFLFESERVLMDQNYEDTEEKILFALIEHIRKKITKFRTKDRVQFSNIHNPSK